ncbi:hypothetical protein DL762_005281 [Monosporascus cannonballus]|uniref:Uncharacterized protein n=1 Tax=Monosporascus cannonballus TaxID=155416 RepID=A0ABY0H5C1_9PEZI|nr:hypothetical protein DL762_005281 [Monosporascus cannonballus]RYO90418.1 hypothetical protein DL763_005338 [Monosporascus cannonballus]
MPRATQKAKKVEIDPEDAIKLGKARRQLQVEKEERLLASIQTMDHLFARIRGVGDTEPQRPQLWRDDVGFWNRSHVQHWNKHAPEGVRPSSAAGRTSYQKNYETPTTRRWLYDGEYLESSPQIRGPVNTRQTYLRDRFNSLRRSSRPSVRGSYDSGYGFARRHLSHRPSTDVHELSGEAEVEVAATPSPSTRYEISQQTLSDDFHLSRPYSGAPEAEDEQAQPVLTVLRTTTRLYQVHRVPPTRSRGSAHGRHYDSKQAPKPSHSALQRTGTREYSRAGPINEGQLAQGGSMPDFDQRSRYQTSKPHGWDEDWVAETTGDEAKSPQHGSSTSVPRYSYGNQAQPSAAKRSRSWDDDDEERRDEDAINNGYDGNETPAYSRSTFASRKRLRLYWRY